MLLVSILALAGATLLYAVVFSPVAFVLVGLSMGLAEGFMLPAMFSATSRVAPAAQRGQAIGTMLAFATAGYAVGPMLAGAVTQAFSFEHSVILSVVVSALGLGTIYLGLSNPPETKTMRNSSAMQRVSLRGELAWLRGSGRLTPLLGLALAAFYSDFVFKGLESTLSLYVTQVLAGTVMQVSLLFTINLLTFSIVSPVAGILSDRIGKDRQIRLALVSIAALLTLAAVATTYLAFLAIISLEFLVGACMTVAFQTSIGDLFTDEGRAGRAYGLVGVLKAAGVASGALAAAFVFERVPRLTYPAIGSVGLLCLIVFGLAWRSAEDVS